MFCDLTSVIFFKSHVVNYQLSREYLQFQLRSSRINKFGDKHLSRITKQKKT